MSESADAITVKKVVLERFLLNSLREFDLDALEPRASVQMRYDCNRLVASLQAYVWAQEIQDETASLTVEWPATVWQAFKDRWFPRWALRRWPVKLASRTTTHRFIVRATLPEYKYVSPVESAVVFKVQGPGSFRFRGDKPEADE